MSAVAIIPARGGSKRIARKNIREFFGKPIIEYSVEVAFRSGVFNGVVVATDDEEIANIARKANAVALMRPPELSDDSVGTQEVTAWALEQLKFGLGAFDYACCIYPCAPLLHKATIIRAYRQLRECENNGFFCVKGQMYFGRAGCFASVPLTAQTICWLRPGVQFEIDIDTENDWRIAEAKYANRNGVVGYESVGVE